MAVKLENNKVVITLNDEGNDAIEALWAKRQAVYDAIVEHNRSDFIQSDNMYWGLVEFLKETEPDEKQYRQMISPH